MFLLTFLPEIFQMDLKLKFKSKLICKSTDLNGTSLVAQTGKNVPAMRRCKFDPWVGKIPWRRERQPTQYSCLENPMEKEAWWATVHGITELDMTEATTHTHKHTHTPPYQTSKQTIQSV